MSSTLKQRTLRGAAAAALALLLGACAAATRPPGAGRPGVNEPPKFAALAASDERRAGALADWKTIVGDQAAASPTPELQPVTATLKALPPNLPTPPRMPLVVLGDKKAQTEEETRESLRRFIATSAPLLGVTPQELSLVEVKDAAGGAKTARYQQNPFSYPLRNGYGVVEVTFTPDLRVVGLSSTAIPDSEQLRRSLAAVKPTLDGGKAAAVLANRAIIFNDRNGVRQTHTVTQADAATARELVIFPVLRAEGAGTLELHVAWEVAVGGPESPPLVYVDAVTGDVLAATQ
ncbi:MAG: hypothetical protein DMF66_05480 [Acidobacteria bacterium]|nr:MAG: hypothetical protein DMF66_05480 [Acidobacteriota bacterium]